MFCGCKFLVVGRWSLVTEVVIVIVIGNTFMSLRVYDRSNLVNSRWSMVISHWYP